MQKSHQTNRKINKIISFIEELRKNKIDAALICNLSNKDKSFYYFTGLDIDYCFLLFIAKQKKAIAYASILEAEKVKTALFNLINKIIIINKPIKNMLSKQLKQCKISKIALNYDNITINNYTQLRRAFKKESKKIKMLDCSQLLDKIRAQKTEEEVECIKNACRITDAVFNETIANFKHFKTEHDVADFIKNRLNHYNTKESFPIIVASGANSANPHHSPENKKLNKGFCIIDFGCNYKGYCSDMTRTIFIGSPSDSELKYCKDIYNKVLSAKKNGENAVKLNGKCCISEKIVRKKLGKLQKNFIHSLGHGIGLDVHEKPNISRSSKDLFLENTTFTIEPGIYFSKKFGIRIEDDYIITKKGLTKLTLSKEELIIIEPDFK